MVGLGLEESRWPRGAARDVLASPSPCSAAAACSAFLASGLDAKPGKTGSEVVADEEDEEEDEGDALGIAVLPVESLIL